MKIDAEFYIKLKTIYNLKEPFLEQDKEKYKTLTNELGGLNYMPEQTDGDGNFLTSGGKFDWFMYHDSNVKPEIRINLMRLWALQMVTQMVNDKAYANEIHSEPKFDISQEEKENYYQLVKKLSGRLHDEIESLQDSMITKKKNKFDFNS